MSRRLSRGTPLMARTPMPADEPEVVAVAAAEPSATAVAGHKAQSGRRRSGGRRSLGGGRRRSFGTPSTPGIDRPKTLEVGGGCVGSVGCRACGEGPPPPRPSPSRSDLNRPNHRPTRSKPR